MNGSESNAWPAASECGFESIYQDQYPRLVLLLVRVTGDRAQAEELAAETLCRFAKHAPLMRTGGDPDAWLHRTAMNLGLRALRAATRRNRHERAATVEMTRSAASPDPLQLVLSAERQSRVRNILARLKPLHAKLLFLRQSGLSYREIANALKLNPASVGQGVARALAAFETGYEQTYGRES